MSLKHLVRIGVGAAALLSTMTMASRAEAGTPKWIAAGDMNGALGACDPGMFAQTSNQGASWSTGDAFRAIPVPCGRGGRINSVIATPGGRIFAAGYRYATNGLKQGVLLYSDDSQNWSVAREIPASAVDTEYLDVVFQARAGGSIIAVLANTTANSTRHSVNGPYTAGWSAFTSAAPQFVNMGVANSSDLSFIVEQTIAGKKCGTWATQASDQAIMVHSAHAFCLPGYDVRIEAQEINWSGGRGIFVGSATTAGVAKPVVRVLNLTSSAGQPILLPGNGTLHDVATDGAGTWVAVGERSIFGVPVGLIFRSADNGATWTQGAFPLSGAAPLHAVIWQTSGFVAVGDSGDVLRSTDGATWTATGTPNPNVSLRSITEID